MSGVVCTGRPRKENHRQRSKGRNECAIFFRRDLGAGCNLRITELCSKKCVKLKGDLAEEARVHQSRCEVVEWIER